MAERNNVFLSIWPKLFQLLIPSTIIFVFLLYILGPDLVQYWFWMPLVPWAIMPIIHFEFYWNRIPISINFKESELDIIFASKDVHLTRESIREIKIYQRQNSQAPVAVTIKSADHKVIILLDKSLSKKLDDWHKISEVKNGTS